MRILLTVVLLLSAIAHAGSPFYVKNGQINIERLLVIGASYSTNWIPWKGGQGVNGSNYLSLADSVSMWGIPIIDTAVAGSTTFSRYSCLHGDCKDTLFEGYAEQLDKGLQMVVSNTPDRQFNARFVLITMPNDCLHADAFGVDAYTTQPCTFTEINEVVNRLINVGKTAIDSGLIPIYTTYPPFEGLDLNTFQHQTGAQWVINERDYSELKALHLYRIKRELPTAIVADTWTYFRVMPDGIHPDVFSNYMAGGKIAKIITSY